jgi:hypothetical protein
VTPARLAAAVLALASAACAEPSLNDYRGIIHCHSYLSHDSKGTPEEIIAACRAASVDFVMMTDHPADPPRGEPLRGLHGGVLFFAGAETGGRLKIEGDLTFVAHPEKFTAWDDPALVGMEIYNTHADAEGAWKDPASLARALGEKGIRRFLAFWDRPDAFLAQWDRMTRERRFVGIAGNDAHQNVRVGNVQFDPYEVVFRFVNTHVLAPALTEAAIREALREGRAYVAFEMERRADGFRFSGNGRPMGSQIPRGDGVELDVRVPQSALIRLLCDGVPITESEGTLVRRRVTAPGVYRVEVDQTIDGRRYPWILSNPIYVR